MVSRKFKVCSLLIILFITGSISTVVYANEPLWDQVAPGIEFMKYVLPDPNNVFVVRMDRNNPDVTLESSIAQGKLAEGREPVSGMVARYDQALNFWGGSSTPPDWGMRNQVVVGINGSYFDWYSGVPQGGLIQSGWYAKRYDDYGGWSGFAWKLNRSAFIGECVYHRPEKQIVSFPSTGVTQEITKTNSSRGSDELVLFTPQYNTRTGTDNSGVEVVVEMARPTMVLPSPAYASGIVRQVRNGIGDSLIPFNSVVLSATGIEAETLLANAQVGSAIHISQEITNCEGADPVDWTKTYAAIQGAFYFLEGGLIHEFNDDPGATERNPRTAIAYDDQYVYFIVVDGRNTARSIGMSIKELGEFTRDTLGAMYGVAQDGGGSSTMVINGSVINNTFCNEYTCDHYIYLPAMLHQGSLAQSAPPEEPQITTSSGAYERWVANGMLMVIAQPGSYSTAFTPGESVSTKMSAELRLGPGTNYAAFTVIPGGTAGTILEQINGLNGVQAKSTYWWYVNFGAVSGWLPEDALAASQIQ